MHKCMICYAFVAYVDGGWRGKRDETKTKIESSLEACYEKSNIICFKKTDKDWSLHRYGMKKTLIHRAFSISFPSQKKSMVIKFNLLPKQYTFISIR